tara:strand:+ start:1067 stop:1852 length:786 start_codon:yes stop_codon:yes gene_type:complete
MINTLTNQVNNLNPDKNASYLANKELLAGVPGQDQINTAYGAQMGKMQEYLNSVDYGVGGRGAASFVNAAGAGIGADASQTGVVAQAAGTVSGQGGQGGDVYSKAIMGGVQSELMALQAARSDSASKERQTFTLGAGAAHDDAAARRMEVVRMLSEVRGKKRGAEPNPLDVGNSFMQFLTNKRLFDEGGSGGSGSGADSSPEETPANLGKYGNVPIGTRRDLWNTYNTAAQGGIKPGVTNPFNANGSLKKGYNIDGTKKKK